MPRAWGGCACAVVFLALVPATGFSQETTPPKVDIFGGYAFADPGKTTVNNIPLKHVPPGWGAAFTYNATRVFGLTFDTGAHYGEQFRTGTIAFGPRLKFPSPKAAPFLEALFGLHRLTFLGLDPNNNIGVVVGGGLDVPVHRRIDFRIFQADYVWGRHDFSPLVPNTINLSGSRLRSGIVFKFGQLGPPPVPMTAICSAEPAEVFDGEPVAVTVTAQNVPRNHTATYSFTASGGKLTARDSVANVDTTGLAPGNYTVTGAVTDLKTRKNAPPASCNAAFTVKERPKHPPTITCSASPNSVVQGEPVTISCAAQSVDHRPLTYDWATSAGKLSPLGAAATLDTLGVALGTVTVQTTAKDDRTPPLSASTTTTISVTAPPPKPQARKLNEIAFKLRSGRVDNVAKAILDDIALVLQRDSDSRAVIVGFFDPTKEKGKKLAETLAAQRAVNAKAYLVREKGIDPGRIEVRYGIAGGTRAEIWLVPAGATLDVTATSAVDESNIKPARTTPRRTRRLRR